MPRPILTGPVSRASVSGPPTSHAPITGGLAGAKLQLRLRQTRTKTYVDALIRLDASTHHQDRVALDQTIAEIAADRNRGAEGTVGARMPVGFRRG